MSPSWFFAWLFFAADSGLIGMTAHVFTVLAADKTGHCILLGQELELHAVLPFQTFLKEFAE